MRAYFDGIRKVEDSKRKRKEMTVDDDLVGWRGN